MAGVDQRVEERFIEAFISQLAIKAFNEAVLLGFFRCNIEVVLLFRTCLRLG